MMLAGEIWIEKKKQIQQKKYKKRRAQIIPKMRTNREDETEWTDCDGDGLAVAR